MNTRDVIEFMEQNLGLKAGYAINPASLKRMQIIVDELEKAGIDKITSRNKDQVKYVARNYVKNGEFEYSTGGNRGMYSNAVTYSYHGRIHDDGTYSEVSTKILTNPKNERQEDESEIREFNKNGLEMKRKRNLKYYSGESLIKESYSALRTDDMVTAHVTSAIQVDDKKYDDISEEVRLEDYRDGKLEPQLSTEYSFSGKLAGYYDEIEKDLVRVNEGKNPLSGNVISINNHQIHNDFVSKKMEFDYACATSPEFENTAIERGLLQPSQRVKANKLRGIYEKVAHKLGDVSKKLNKDNTKEIGKIQ